METTWKQWDLQEEKRLAKVAETQAYIELNNTYLSIERGTIKLNVFHSNNLRTLVGKAYPDCPVMVDYWMNEFTKLPNWFNV